MQLTYYLTTKTAGDTHAHTVMCMSVWSRLFQTFQGLKRKSSAALIAGGETSRGGWKHSRVRVHCKGTDTLFSAFWRKTTHQQHRTLRSRSDTLVPVDTGRHRWFESKCAKHRGLWHNNQQNHLLHTCLRRWRCRPTSLSTYTNSSISVPRKAQRGESGPQISGGGGLLQSVCHVHLSKAKNNRMCQLIFH